MDLWEDTRETGLLQAQPTQELEDACLVRDQLQNRLELTHPEHSGCAERSLRVLRSADALFRQFTTESTTAADLSAHNHYPHRGEWWWRRLPRRQIPTISSPSQFAEGTPSSTRPLAPR